MMQLRSRQIAGPKIRAFLLIFPDLEAKYGAKEFHVDEAIQWPNSRQSLGVWCYRAKTCIRIEKEKAEEDGLISLDLQNACHCFAGKTRCSVIDAETNNTFQLLDHVGRLMYRIREG